MVNKNNMVNKGFPKSVDIINDLKAVENVHTDSWYIKSEFECNGKKLGFTWHQGVSTTSLDGKKAMTLECLFMNVTDDTWINKNRLYSISDTANIDYDKMHVYSPGVDFSGDHHQMDLKVLIDDILLDMHFTTNGEVLYNGVTGLIEFGCSNSYQFSFPNMKMEGTLTIAGEEYKVTNATAWFDRQYGTMNNKKVPATLLPGVTDWLWIGFSSLKDGKGAISLWDVYNPGSRNAFATILREDGTEANVLINIRYDDIWTSAKSGYKYPKTIHVDIPDEEFKLTLRCLADLKYVEFVHEGELKKLSGCQCLFDAQGTYKDTTINRICDVEIIGNLCGEDQKAIKNTASQ